MKMKTEAKQQLETTLKEVEVNTNRRDGILSRIMEVESKIRYMEDNKKALQSNPHYERQYSELCAERARLNKYIGQ